MKLRLIHLLLIVLGIIVLSNAGFGIKEGMKHGKKKGKKGKKHSLNNNNYILKSQIVPPVCPRCPDVKACPKQKSKCPPCPPCARCPQAPFECKKVPNYSSSADQDYLPRPLLTDFSSFM